MSLLPWIIGHGFHEDGLKVLACIACPFSLLYVSHRLDSQASSLFIHVGCLHHPYIYAFSLNHIIQNDYFMK
jgi:hypothetical protein